jgi:hypothetical protein
VQVNIVKGAAYRFIPLALLTFGAVNAGVQCTEAILDRNEILVTSNPYQTDSAPNHTEQVTEAVNSFVVYMGGMVIFRTLHKEMFEPQPEPEPEEIIIPYLVEN